MTRDDLDAAVDLLRSAETRFHGEPFVDRADIASEWASPAADLPTASLGVLDADRLVAWAEVSYDRSMIVVDAAHHGRGIGTALTQWSERLLAGHGKEAARHTVPENDTAGRAVMEELGYSVAWTGWSLRLDEGDVIARRPLPEGVEVRTFDLADAEATHAVIEDAFAEWITRPRTTFEEWRIENLEREGSDPSHHRIAVADGEVVGASVVHDSGDTAWVYQLAVRRDVRGRGIAQELLATSFAGARERGVPRAALGTDTRTGALGLYESLGMRVVATWNVWSRSLSPTGPDATS